MTRWPVLLAAAAMLIAGGWQAVATGTAEPLIAFAAGALIGSGITLVAQWAQRELQNPEDR